MIRDNISFGKLLESLRLKAGYSDAKSFGDEIGVSGQMVRDYERGHSQPGYTTLAKIALKLNTSIDSIVFGKEERLKTISTAAPDVNISHLTPEQQDDLQESVRIILTLQAISRREPPMDVCPIKVYRRALEEALTLLMAGRGIKASEKSKLMEEHGYGHKDQAKPQVKGVILTSPHDVATGTVQAPAPANSSRVREEALRELVQTSPLKGKPGSPSTGVRGKPKTPATAKAPVVDPTKKARE